LLDQIDAEVALMTADHVYDGEAVYDAVTERHPRDGHHSSAGDIGCG
jgi:hypothetical protein